MSEYQQYQGPTDEGVDEKIVMGNQGGEPIVDEVHVADFSGFEDINEGRALGMDVPRTLNKHMTVMEARDNETNGRYALYGQTDEGVECITLADDVFEALGRPSKINVTVRPHQ